MKPTASRTVLIIGAGSGIGAALARGFAVPGTGLLVHCRGGDEAGRNRIEAVARACRGAGAEVRTSFGDLAERGAGAGAVEAALDVFGGLDQVVHMWASPISASSESSRARRFMSMAA
jgi:NAD(P)-dependent dehydrogenase (short-subunit alcohol dehydrogenase family)